MKDFSSNNQESIYSTSYNDDVRMCRVQEECMLGDVYIYRMSCFDRYMIMVRL